MLWSRDKRSRQYSKELEEQYIKAWKPAPLVPEVPENHVSLKKKHAESKVDKFITKDGVKLLNFSSTDFFNFVGNKRIEEATKMAVRKYGVGSCGPRNFYGTATAHLDLEKKLADFLECEETVLYSYGIATIISAIPTYSGKDDIIFIDKGVCFPIQHGVEHSKSQTRWFKHNNMNDLESQLKEQDKFDSLDGKLAMAKRRFLVVEGLYASTGDLCPLPQIMELKWKYKFRVIIDESYSIGIVGDSGKGVTEHYGIDISDVDLITGSLEHAFASAGGFCAGRTFVVSHQRLSGSGYCFSASLPPLLAVAAEEGLSIIREDPERLSRLRRNCEFINSAMLKAFSGTQLETLSWKFSPIQHIHCKLEGKDESVLLLSKFMQLMANKSYALGIPTYIEKLEKFERRPSVRLCISSEFTKDELEGLIEALFDVLSNLNSEKL